MARIPTPETDAWMNLWGAARGGARQGAGDGPTARRAASRAAPAPDARRTAEPRPQPASPLRRAWNGVAQAQAAQTATAEAHAQAAGSWAGNAMHTLNGWGAGAFHALPGGVQRGLGKVETLRETAAEGVGTAWNWAGAHVTATAKVVDGAARQAGTAADGLAGAAIASGTGALRRTVGDHAADAFQHGAGAVRDEVRAGTQFQYGAATDLLAEGAGMVSGVGTLAAGAYRLTVDGAAREQAAAGVTRLATRLHEDPSGVALDLGHAGYNAGAGWVKGARTAAGRGGLPEYLGNSAGHVAGFVASFVAPETLLGKAGAAGKAGEAANAATRAEHAATAAGGAGTAARTTEAGRTATAGRGLAQDAHAAPRPASPAKAAGPAPMAHTRPVPIAEPRPAHAAGPADHGVPPVAGHPAASTHAEAPAATAHPAHAPGAPGTPRPAGPHAAEAQGGEPAGSRPPSDPPPDRPAAGKPAPTVRTFDTFEEFNEAANAAEPDSIYKWGSYSWETDGAGRPIRADGKVEVKKFGRNDTKLQREIGQKTPGREDGDIGFHLIGDNFNAPTNRLNVVPGNGVSAGELKSLNLSAYKKFENAVKKLAERPGANVEMRIEPVYNPGNATRRPDKFVASYRNAGGRWTKSEFLNKPQ